MLDDKELELAEKLYREFFSRYPEENPTDINTRNKYDFMIEKQYDALALMQEARKMNTKVNNFPCPWSKRDHFKGDLF